MPVIAVIGDGQYHLSVRLPEGFGFAVSWQNETDLYQAIIALADMVKEPNGLRVGIEQMVHYFSARRHG